MTSFPALYQINTRICLSELSDGLRRPATLSDLPDAELDRIAARGFGWVWPLGIWQTGSAGREVSRTRPEWIREYQSLLTDLKDDDITGSPFAIQTYQVHTSFGGDEALANLRGRLHQRGIKLLLDFVPNHTALDHPWVMAHPEFYIAGDEHDLSREPHNYINVQTGAGSRVLAHGRDPYFPGWPDTLQLNLRHPHCRLAILKELGRIAEVCDGVRCDMAMLLLPEIIQRTWGDKSTPADGAAASDKSFWLEAIAAVRAIHPRFLFMAEVYWDLEWELQQQGFDYTYDKRLYDRLHEGNAEAARGHLHADMDFQKKSVRFLENHDEPRAATAFSRERHQAAAVVTYLLPGMRFFHEGQLEGRRKRVPMHLGRRPTEMVDTAIEAFYEKLLAVLRDPIVRAGSWRLLDCRPVWEANSTWRNFLAFAWESKSGRILVVVNYAPEQSQCFAPLGWSDLRNRPVLLADRLGFSRYERNGNDLTDKGLFLDMPGYGYHVFDVSCGGTEAAG